MKITAILTLLSFLGLLYFQLKDKTPGNTRYFTHRMWLGFAFIIGAIACAISVLSYD